jgi:hypothetical protein
MTPVIGTQDKIPTMALGSQHTCCLVRLSWSLHVSATVLLLSMYVHRPVCMDITRSFCCDCRCRCCCAAAASAAASAARRLAGRRRELKCTPNRPAQRGAGLLQLLVLEGSRPVARGQVWRQTSTAARCVQGRRGGIKGRACWVRLGTVRWGHAGRGHVRCACSSHAMMGWYQCRW